MRQHLKLLGLACVSQTLLVSTCLADGTTADIEKRLEALEKAVKAQQKVIDGQQRIIEDQQQKLSTLSPMSLQEIRGAGPATPAGASPAASAPAGNTTTGNDNAPNQPVGKAPEQERPQVAVISDQGGVLTQKGHLVVEPSVQYIHTSNNTLTFRGVSLQDTVLIGVIEASNAARDLVSPALTARYGVTRDFELEAKIPWVYRSDRLTFLIPQAGQPDLQRTQNLSGNDLGDIEVAAHYQITDNPPYLVGNLRFKTTTGKGPFDIKRDSQGIDQESATGSGFYAVEPSLTILWPTDPAVLFATVNYQWNIGSDVNTTIGSTKIGQVDPGDSVGIALGMGFAVNDDLSFSLGYKYNYYFETTEHVTTTANGISKKGVEKTNTLQLGSLLFGMGYRINKNVGVNLDGEVGITSDAPDMSITLRVPITFDIF